MTNNKAFGSLLSRIRKERGFSSAHQFFKGAGGSKGLGLAFSSYWDIERGKKLPRSWRLKAIMAALGLDPHSPLARELVTEYFKALSGSDELLRILSAPAPAGGDLISRELAEAAIHQALAQRSVNLTIEQWKLRTRDTVTSICHSYLSNTSGWVTVRELSEATRFKPEEVRKALKALAAGGLLEFSGDKARSPFVGKVVKALPATPATAAIKAAQRTIWNKWVADSRLVDAKRMTIRMSKTGLDAYRQHLAKAVSLACIYENSAEDRQDSAIYTIEANIFRTYPRD
ncbi:MAG: hypothetical protein Q7R35_20230 [Elusimicrobiota bacterium]|nr:hypothetical protein [Elusimicrobiota bacterium]